MKLLPQSSPVGLRGSTPRVLAGWGRVTEPLEIRLRHKSHGLMSQFRVRTSKTSASLFNCLVAIFGPCQILYYLSVRTARQSMKSSELKPRPDQLQIAR